MTAEAAVQPSRRALTARSRRTSVVLVLWLVAGGNAVAILWLWLHGGGVSRVHSTGELLTSLGRATGLLGAYLALIQVLLLARLPWLERLVGLDRLSVWHRWNGHATLDLIVAHTVLIVWGYALVDRLPLGREISAMLGGGVYPGMITATVGTGLLIAVVVSSVVIVKRRLRYETWYAVHLAAYAGIALGWFHQIPTGNELVLDQVAADYWRGLYAATLALLVGYRVLVPLANGLRYQLRVADVVSEGPGVVSMRITGRGLHRLEARAGQFFVWRFLSRGRWWTAHPFSLSAAPDGRSLRITVKALGDHTARLAAIRPGTRVLAEGPFGVFTGAARRRRKALLVAGGIGITPIRALLDELEGDVRVLYRVVSEDDVIFREELAGRPVEVVTGDHATEEGARLLSPEHLRELVPDLAERDVFVCGPPSMAQAIARNVRKAGVPRRHVHTERFAL
jgi:predicted ferric reductase